MDSATTIKEPMDPPPLRPLARSQAKAPPNTDHYPISHSQAKRSEHRSKSLKNRRELDVIVPPLEISHASHEPRPDSTSNDDGVSAETDPGRTTNSSAGKRLCKKYTRLFPQG